MDEQQAIAGLRRGEIGALEPLVRAHQLRATRAAYLITRDRALAEDIVQAAFVRAFERIAQLRPGGPFGPWFLRGVVNDALKAVARAKRRAPLPDDEDGGWGGLRDAAPGPGELLTAGETRAEVWAALAALPAPQRAAIVLRYYLDLSEAEIAAQLGAPAGTVKWRLHAARRRLRQLLGSERAPDGATAAATEEGPQG